MWKFIVYIHICLCFFLGENHALDIQGYTELIDGLNNNVKFIDEYTKWSSKLFAHPNYLYGDLHQTSPCSVDSDDDEYDSEVPESVHRLRPKNINCIAAFGDSFTTGLNAHATTPVDLLLEDRGISWSIGGDYTYSQIPTLPNALKTFNSKLKGFSSRQHEMSLDRQEFSDHRLNIAKSGFHMNSLLYQAKSLIRRLKNETFCKWNDDWKLLTIFIGINDLCTFCKTDLNDSTYTPEQYQNYVRDALDILYNASVPRMLINLVPLPNIGGYKDLFNENYICRAFLNELCPCANMSDENLFKNYNLQYQQVLVDLIKSNRYDKRDDFTVVIQPFLLNTEYPLRNSNNTIDKSYLAPDCFHFSGKAHSQIARSLWNNMLEPIGNKRMSVSYNETIKCPTRKYPYIFTSQNSDRALAELKRSNTSKSIDTIISTSATTATTTSAAALNLTSSNTVKTSTSSTFDLNITSSSIIAIQSSDTTIKTIEVKSTWKRLRLLLAICFLVMCILYFIYSVRKRRRSCIQLPQTDNSNYNGLQEESDDNDVEIYTQPNQDVKYYNDKQITQTHGTRITFE